MIQKLFILMFTLSAVAGKAQILQSPANDSNTMAFASDTQAPMWIETLWLKANKNRTATRMVFSGVLEQKPRALFLLGDVVNLGYSNKQWKPMDKYLHNLRDSNIAVHAILGNHEVMGQSAKGQRKFQKRFPDHVQTGYVQVVDSVAIVLLNSNFTKLTKEQDEEQVTWYKKTIEQLDLDSSIRFIITACHHSPFTNSKIVKPCTAVQEKFVPPFLASKKSRLFLSGHCHGFEHYQVLGKDFMVIGGGGGLHQPLKPCTDEQPDLAKDYKPLFHYLTVKRINDKLEVTSFRLNDSFNGFDEGMKIVINETPTIQKTIARK
jgi:hypothetical protein